MTEQLSVANLTTKAVRVWLALLLAGSGETQFAKSEFASLTGVPGQSIPGALVELENVGLIPIVTHEGKTYEDTYVAAAPPAAPDSGVVLEVGDSVGSQEGSQTDEGEDQVSRLLELCVLADQSKLRDNQVDALIGCWNVAFPEDKYPVQRLQIRVAKDMLKDHTAEEVGKIILRAGERMPPIEWPKAYVEAALSKKNTEGDETIDPINDELRALARLGNEQYGNKKASSTWFS
jgi:hypothetical protein